MDWRTIVWGGWCVACGAAVVALSAVGSGAGSAIPSIRLRVDQVIEQFVIDLEDTTPEDTPRYNLIALADLNGDDFVDLVTVNTDEDELNLNFGTGSGLFDDPVTIEAVEPDDIGFSPIAVVPGDFTGPFSQNNGAPDGHIDLALVDDFGFVTIMIGDGEGDFATPDQLLDYLDIIAATGAVAADFDGNGDLDLAIADGDQVAFVCNEKGTLTLCNDTYLVVDDLNPTIVDLAVGDFDDDGRPDVAAIAADHDFAYPIFSDGGGNFTLGFPISLPEPVITESHSLAVADFNDDGFDDVLVVSGNQFGDNGLVALGAANRAFPRAFPFETAFSATGVAAGNFSDDENPDILISLNDGRLVYEVGDGTGDFSTSQGAQAIFDRGVDGRFLGSAAVLKSADLNNDGLLDVVGLVGDGTEIEVGLNVLNQPTQTPVIPTPTPSVAPSPSQTAEPTATASPFDSDDDACAVVAPRGAIAPSWLGLGFAILVAARRRLRRC